jgi:hypothetical protein
MPEAEAANATWSGTVSLFDECNSVGESLSHPTTTRAVQTLTTIFERRIMIAPLSATQEERTAAISLRAIKNFFGVYGAGS